MKEELKAITEQLMAIAKRLTDLAAEPESARDSRAIEKFDKDHPFNPDYFGWVDLSLPSGRLWADRPAPGYYQYSEAVDIFGKYLPTSFAMVELTNECEWTWDDDRKGYEVKGPNGNTIFLPALGYQDYDHKTKQLIPESLSIVGSCGYWWAFAPNSKAYARHQSIYSTGVYPLNASHRAAALPCCLPENNIHSCLTPRASKARGKPLTTERITK